MAENSYCLHPKQHHLYLFFMLSPTQFNPFVQDNNQRNEQVLNEREHVPNQNQNSGICQRSFR